MRRSIVVIAAAAALFGAAVPGLLMPRSAVAEAPAEAPAVADRFVLRPSFTTSLGPVNAGSAFAVKRGERTVLVTALHLLGPAGGLKAQVETARLAEVVQSISVRGAFTGEGKPPVAVATKILAVPGAHPMGDDAAGDILVFELAQKTGLDRLQVRDTPKLAPGALAAAAPSVGDAVWLVAKVRGGDDRAHPAKVVQIDDKWLFYEIHQADLDLAGTNGAPIVNAAGEVVGIQLGGGVMEDGKLVGAANPWAAVRKALDAAVGGG